MVMQEACFRELNDVSRRRLRVVRRRFSPSVHRGATMTGVVAAALASLLVAASAAGAAESAWGRLAEHIRGRVSLGTRVTAFTLTESTSSGLDREAGETFIGHLTELEEVQNYFPTNLFVSYFAMPYLGLEFANDGVEATARNSNNHYSDGNVSATGWLLSLILRYPNTSRFTPSIGLGIGFWDPDFSEEAWWHYGYRSPDAWRDHGSPNQPRRGINKTISVYGAQGVVIQGELDIRVREHWSIDLQARYAGLETDAEFYQNGELHRSGAFPLSHIAFGAGVRYTF